MRINSLTIFQGTLSTTNKDSQSTVSGKVVTTPEQDKKIIEEFEKLYKGTKTKLTREEALPLSRVLVAALDNTRYIPQNYLPTGSSEKLSDDDIKPKIENCSFSPGFISPEETACITLNKDIDHIFEYKDYSKYFHVAGYNFGLDKHIEYDAPRIEFSLNIKSDRLR
ncbi:MAG: hypothetical protein LBK53_04455 [Heliobacteriaceae bacterium]|jgi:hypothetical protein|nr:hypothetical protein [Heliobacteriaceae bacterium]